MKLVVIGTGYVGLVTGACFAEMGNHVICVDVDRDKLARLNRVEIPIYEPGLEQIVERNFNRGSLEFTDDLKAALDSAQVAMIAVGTPPGEDGSADLRYVLDVAQSLGEHMTDYLVIADKSTVPVGTAEKVVAQVTEALIARGEVIPFDVVSNPEFLKEGAAVEDFMRPDRVVVGTDSERARSVLRELYEPFSRTREKLMFMGVRDAEMTKYAANAMLATKISFMNEIANLCEYLGADVENVRRGIGSDPRIGFSFIFPGCGYGGSCFPKDVKAIIGMAKDVGFSPILMQAVEDRDQSQKHRLVERIVESYSDDLSGLIFGVWGLAFKPGTDDVREASSTVIIRELVERGATVKAYDPAAMKTILHEIDSDWIGTKLVLCDHQYAAVNNADALILVTEWNLFRQPDFSTMERVMKSKTIFDGRNQYDPRRLREQGWE
ncbi:MAG: UDP-glucose/GDP-mannose dehydrogenase family protein [Oceanospirillales bacterium TMED33]|nr:UDP-glucose 6-dehydrogenase [Gammaproteobacteria bacterium]RPG22799.1 MAG: UDP-glucose/GDP-mannose dehydrogenase family protein [Oceanospirillales bacterium TMED33]